MLLIWSEICAVFRRKPGDARSILDIISKICDLDYLLKPPEQILQEAIEAFASGEKQPNPYFSSTAEEVQLLRQFFSTPKNPDLLRPVIDQVDSMKTTFFENMLQANEKTREELGIQGGKLPKFEEGRPPTIEEYFASFGPEIARAAAKRAGVSDIVDLEQLLAIRPVRAFAGISASWIYSQIVENRRLQASDGFDVRHMVQASDTDGLISNDGPFRRLAARIRLNNFEVVTFVEFVETSPEVT